MTLDGAPVERQDRMYCMLNGWGVVESVNNDGQSIVLQLYFQKTRSSFMYNEYGVGPYKIRTLFWSVPTIIPPGKSEDNNTIFVDIMTAVANVLRKR